MKFLVTCKRVTDYEAKIKFKADKSGIETNGVNMIMNPFDEIAVEEALRQRDKVPGGGEVVVATIGTADCLTQLRSALALGADRGILVKCDSALDSYGVAKLLQKVIEKEQPDLVIMGKQAIDDDNNQAGQLLAELLGWGQATFANTITIEGNKATVVREADGGLETIAVELPAIITTDLRLNEPRYPSTIGIMKARKKPVDELEAAGLGVDFAPRVRVTAYLAPPEKKAGQKVPDVATLVDKLKTEAKVL